MFFIRNCCILFRNACFSSEIAVFCSETHVFHQKLLYSVQKRMFFIKNCCILFRNACFSSEIAVFCSETHVFSSEIAVFCSETHVSEQKTGSLPQPLQRRGARIVRKLICSRFRSPPLEGPREALVSTPLLWRGWGRLRFFCKIQQFPPRNCDLLAEEV